MQNYSSITTRTGDDGKTYTLGGERVFKSDLRIVLPGFIDELVTQISLIQLSISERLYYKNLLTWIQTCLFVAASRFSDPYCQSLVKKQITEKELCFLEKISATMEQKTQMPKSFIIPGSTEISCQLDLARCICRRIERRMVEFVQKFSNHNISKETFAFINRLSDFFYIFARKEENSAFIALNYTIIEDFPNMQEDL